MNDRNDDYESTANETTKAQQQSCSALPQLSTSMLPLIDQLPDNLLIDIFSFFQPIDICKQLSRVSRRFYRLSQSKSLWHSIRFVIDESEVERNRCFGLFLTKVCHYFSDHLYILQMSSAIIRLDISFAYDSKDLWSDSTIHLSTFEMIFSCVLPAVTHLRYCINVRRMCVYFTYYRSE